MSKWTFVNLFILLMFVYRTESQRCNSLFDCGGGFGSNKRFCCNGYCCAIEEGMQMTGHSRQRNREDFSSYRRNRDRDDDFSFMPEAAELSGKSVFKFIGIAIALMAALVIIGLICCCCLPCCLLAKRRQRGQTHGPAVPESQPMNATVISPYPGTTQGYPPQQQPSYPPPQQQYPPPPAPGYGPPAGYPAQPPPYPGPPLGMEQGYPTKQSAYNPNAL